jgi:hypothetical protein
MQSLANKGIAFLNVLCSTQGGVRFWQGAFSFAAMYLRLPLDIILNLKTLQLTIAW